MTLLQKATEEMREAVRDMMRNAISEAVDSQYTARVIDQWLMEFLSTKKCWLNFEEGKVDVLIGVGNGDAAEAFEPEIELDYYGDSGGPKNQTQVDDVVERIATARSFIAEIEKGCRVLELQVEAYNRKHK